jgi:hypothetical protein
MGLFLRLGASLKRVLTLGMLYSRIGSDYAPLIGRSAVGESKALEADVADMEDLVNARLWCGRLRN